VSILAPVPNSHDPIEPSTRKVSAVWSRWFQELKARVESLEGGGGGGGNIDASQIVSGTISLARLADIANAQIAAAAAIAWSKISKTGALLSDLGGILGLAAGGTGANLSATGGASQYLKQSSAGATVTVGTIAAGDLPTGIDAAKIADGSVSNTEFQYLDGLTGNVQTQIDRRLPILLYQKSFSYNYVGLIGSGVIQGGNIPNGTVSAAGHAEASTATFYGVELSTSAVIGNNASVVGANGMVPTIVDPIIAFRIKTSADISSVRLFFGVTNGAFSNADTFNAHYLGFRYSTVVPDPGWVGICSNGVAVNAQATGLVAAIAADTEYTLTIRVSGDGTAAHFSVNGGAEQTLSVNLPTNTIRLRFDFRVIAQAASSRAFKFNSCYCETRDGA
jgi:hypothetical protein